MSIENLLVDNNYTLKCNTLDTNNYVVNNNTHFFTNTTAGSPFQSSFTLNWKVVGDLITFTIPRIVEVNAQPSQAIVYEPDLPVSIRPTLANKSFILPIYNSGVNFAPSYIGVLTITTTGDFAIEPFSPAGGLTNFTGQYNGFESCSFTYDKSK